MRLDVVLRYVGMVMLFVASFMLLSAGISYVSARDSAFYPLLLSALLTALLGAFPLIFVEKKEQITNKEGFCIVVGSWLVACVVGMFRRINSPEMEKSVGLLLDAAARISYELGYRGVYRTEGRHAAN